MTFLLPPGIKGLTEDKSKYDALNFMNLSVSQFAGKNFLNISVLHSFCALEIRSTIANFRVIQNTTTKNLRYWVDLMLDTNYIS